MTDESVLKDIREKWQQMGPPLRPGPEIIALMTQPIAERDGPVVLVLGATPELVDAAVRLNAQRVLAMDWNGPFLEAMRGLGTEDWAIVEPLVADWREPQPQLEGTIDVVVGDGSLAFLAFPDEWADMLGLIHSYLVPDGMLATRTVFQGSEPIDFETCLEEILAAHDTDHVDLPALCGETRLAIVLASANEQGEIDLGRRAGIEQLAVEILDARFPDPETRRRIRAGLGVDEDLRERKILARAVPPWDAAKGVLAAEGFELLSENWGDANPIERTFCLFVARRPRSL